MQLDMHDVTSSAQHCPRCHKPAYVSYGNSNGRIEGFWSSVWCRKC